jgi:hypothetical protein
MRWRHASKRVRACGRELGQGGLREHPGVAYLLAVQIPLAQRALDDLELDSELARGVRCVELAAHAPRLEGHSVSPRRQPQAWKRGGPWEGRPVRAESGRTAISPHPCGMRVHRILW